MPKKQEASKKTVEKQKQKIIEDKTFGLKNKKGKKQQQYVKNVYQQVKGQTLRQQEAERAKKLEKEAEADEMKEMRAIFKPVVEKQKVEAGVDPKSVLCAYFKKGACSRGNKCKFSHDLTIERRQEKKDLYTDDRDLRTADQVNVEGLSMEELEEHNRCGRVVISKTDIVCKFFLEAVEANLYGWFWKCPNGGDACHYRHALPPGYVLKRDRTHVPRMDDTTIEDLVEKERGSLEGDLTPVTLESFTVWKSKKIQEKKDRLQKEILQKKEEMSSGKIVSRITGKEAFSFDPNLMKQDDEDANDDNMLEERRNETRVDAVDVTACLPVIGMVKDEHSTRAITLRPRDRYMTPTDTIMVSGSPESEDDAVEEVLDRTEALSLATE